MKILLSEAHPDYPHYQFPYAVWAFPEPSETPSDIFAAGFLPSSRELDRFYLCRQVRVGLRQFSASSENRRILRKGAAITLTLVPRDQYRYTEDRRRSFKDYADAKFGADVMTWSRLDGLFTSRLVSHVMVFEDTVGRREVGTVTLYLEPPRTAFYYYAFYDLNHEERSLGMYMMTRAVQHFADAGYDYLYLGTVYSRNALYKTQFNGAEFFNGFAWSQDLCQLKYLLQRDQDHPPHHLLDGPDFVDRFYPQGPAALARTSGWRLAPPRL